ncbi:hypothetical protein [Microbacterium imperiale]|nr:hypothetical protein [Microbacterium imperiale]MBP2420021.1 hypothetical protein [Microbacterium imperiale]
MSTSLEPLTQIRPCVRHRALLDAVRYMVPAVIEECADCEVTS